MSKIVLITFLTAASLLCMSFRPVLPSPDDSIDVECGFSPFILLDTIIVEEEESIEDDEFIDELPLGVPAMEQGDVVSIVCNDEDELDSYTIKYINLSDDAMELYQAILEKAGFEIEEMTETGQGSTLKAQDGFVNVVIMFSDGSATINADLL